MGKDVWMNELDMAEIRKVPDSAHSASVDKEPLPLFHGGQKHSNIFSSNHARASKSNSKFDWQQKIIPQMVICYCRPKELLKDHKK